MLVQASSDFLKKREKDAATINALQNLSRELQDQNRKIKAEVVKKTQEDDNQRRALIEKFQGSLESISKQLGTENNHFGREKWILDENAGTNEMLRNRNNDLSNSLEQVIEKSEEREKALIKTIDALKEQDKLLREKVHPPPYRVAYSNFR